MFPADHWWLLPLLIVTFASLAWTGALMCCRGVPVQAVHRGGRDEGRPCGPARLRALFSVGRATAVWPLAATLAIVVSAGCAWAANVPAVSAVPSGAPMAAVHPAFLDDPVATAVTDAAVAFADQRRQDVALADRDWSKLDPSFRDRLEQVLGRLELRGYSFQLIEGYRSPERQEYLLAMPVRVTYAGAWQSRHQFGLAADLAPVSAGRVVLSAGSAEGLDAYQALGDEAEAAGLTWGGRWTLRDFGHVELAVRNSGEIRG